MVRRYPTARPGFLFIPTMEQDDIYMREALKEARYAASEDEVPVGAVIVCRGRIIGKGHNMTERLNDPTAHAEMIAITAATEAMGGKYLICNCRTLPYVCRCTGMVTDRQSSLWSI